MDNQNENRITRSKNLISMIVDFLDRLKKKAQPLDAMAEQAEQLRNDILNFVEELGEDMDEWFFWKFINEPQEHFFEMELHTIFDCLIEDSEWPHPE